MSRLSSEPIVFGLSPETEAMLSRVERDLGRERTYALIEQAWRLPAKIVGGKAAVLARQRKRTRTGAMSQSIDGAVIRVNGVPGVRIGGIRGPATRYIGIQEHGTRGKNPDSPFADVRPRNAKALAFAPDGSPALTPAGVDRYGGPRRFPEPLVFVPFRRGNVVGALYRSKDLASLDAGVSLRRINAVYLLLRKASIAPGRFLIDGLTKGIAEDLGPALRRVLGQVLVGQGGAK